MNYQSENNPPNLNINEDIEYLGGFEELNGILFHSNEK
jgi:hypothetical protein